MHIDSNKDNNEDAFNISDIQITTIKNRDFIIGLFYELKNEKISYDDRDLQNVFESMFNKKGNINNQINLNLKKCNSSREAYNSLQNYNTAINNNNIQMPSQNNLNLQIQNNISLPVDFNKYNNFNNTFVSNNNSFNKFGNNIIGNNNFGFNNQPIIENKMSADNPNVQIYNDDFQLNTNILPNINNNKTNINNQSPNNFFEGFDSSGTIREFSKTIYQNNDIPKYFNQEYDIIEEEKINDIYEITNEQIGFL